MSHCEYLIEPRKLGGYRLRLLKDGEEIGGGVFPLDGEITDAKEADICAFSDAQDEANNWLFSGVN